MNAHKKFQSKSQESSPTKSIALDKTKPLKSSPESQTEQRVNGAKWINNSQMPTTGVVQLGFYSQSKKPGTAVSQPHVDQEVVGWDQKVIRGSLI